jgi:hypothetical protein
LLRWIVVGVVAVLVLGGSIAAFASGGGGGDDSNPVLITAKVIRRDLVDEATVTGTLGRVEERTISASAASGSGSGAGSTGLGGGGGAAGLGGGGATVSSVYVEDGGTLEAEKPILSLDGRDSITENGDVPFFRKLDVGATGVDVTQLEQILQSTGYSPGKVDQLYTEQTRSALAQWQAAHQYPGDNPSTKQTVTVSLGQGAGYTIGKQSSAAATIGPYVPPTKKVSYHPTSGTGTPAVDAIATAHVQAVSASMHALACPPPPATSTVSISASPTSVKEGGSSLITVTASPAPDAGCPIQVILTPGGDATPGLDYNSFPPTVNLSNAQPSTNFTLKTRTDLVAESPEHVLISPAPSANYNVGSSASVTITDGSVTPVVTLTEGSGIVPEGQVATFTAGLSQPLNVPLQIFLDYSGDAQEGEDYSPAAGALIFAPGTTSLPITIQTVNDDRVEPDKSVTVQLDERSSYRIGDPDGGDVLIKSEDLPTIIITGGSNTSRGGGSLFQITADQPPLVDTTVQYQATGTAQPGVDIEPLTGTVLLPAGATTATVPLLTLNTDVVFIPTDMIVAHWPTRVSKVLVEQGDIVPAGTPLFSITEAGFTVTLKASAADRSKLKVGQQVTVQVQGGDKSAPGVITELDETATIDPETKQQTYEGKVQVQGDLGAADGAPVTIDVVLEDKPAVLTVPIAAVKQNGDGKDVVRVIDLRHGGRISERIVTTGLAEGSYIEVKTGLKGNEVVVVQVDQGSG